MAPVSAEALQTGRVIRVCGALKVEALTQPHVT
jgi:hypothetical protein